MPLTPRRLGWRSFRRPFPSVAAWALTVPLGTMATASALLPRFMAARPGPRFRSGWSSLILGREIARLMRLDLRRRERLGTDVWSFEPGPRGVGLPWA